MLVIWLLLMAATCAVVSATIFAVLNAAQSADVRLAIVVVDKPAIWVVDSAEMVEAMVTILVAGGPAFLRLFLRVGGLLLAGSGLDDVGSGTEAFLVDGRRDTRHASPTT
jgi:hypothetical protein